MIKKKDAEQTGELRWNEYFRQKLEAENTNINQPQFDWETFKYICEQLSMEGRFEDCDIKNSNLSFLYK